MLTAIVLVHTAADRIPEVAQHIADLPGVAEVYSCAGDVDLIALLRVRDHEQIADIVTERISKGGWTVCSAQPRTLRSARTPAWTPTPASRSASSPLSRQAGWNAAPSARAVQLQRRCRWLHLPAPAGRPRHPPARSPPTPCARRAHQPR